MMSDKAVDEASTSSSPRALRWWRRNNATLNFGVILLFALVAFTLLVPIVSPYTPNEIDPAGALQGPSMQHGFGTDSFGRDLLTRATAGYKISLAISVVSVAAAFVVGTALGVAAGMTERYQWVVMRPLDLFMSFPTVVLAIVICGILGTGAAPLTLSIAVACVPVIGRIAAASVRSVNHELYLAAARTRGVGLGRLVTRHVIPNSISPVIVQSFLLMGQAVLLEAGLSYLGLGVSPPAASLGLMLAEGQEQLSVGPWAVLAPGIAIVLLVLAYICIGNGLHQLLDPRARKVRA